MIATGSTASWDSTQSVMSSKDCCWNRCDKDRVLNTCAYIRKQQWSWDRDTTTTIKPNNKIKQTRDWTMQELTWHPYCFVKMHSTFADKVLHTTNHNEFDCSLGALLNDTLERDKVQGIKVTGKSCRLSADTGTTMSRLARNTFFNIPVERKTFSDRRLGINGG